MLNTVSVPYNDVRRPITLPRSHEAGEVYCLSHTDHPYKFHALRGENISVCLAEFSEVHRYRDFCRVAAVIRVVFKVQPSLSTFDEVMLTSVPIPPASEIRQLRKKLIRSAVNLVLYTQSYHERGPSHITLTA